MSKNLKKIATATIVAAGLAMGAAAASAQSSQQWNETGVGSFDAIGMVLTSGSTFSFPGMTLDSGTTNWSQLNNSTMAFATFDPTSNLTFTSWTATGPANTAMDFYAWNGNTLAEGVHWNGTAVDGLAASLTRAQMVAAVPEPETYAMLLAGLGMMGAIARRRKSKQG